MKKRIFGAALLIVIAVTAGWNFNQSKNEVVLSELALANIEAIAQGELQSGVDADTLKTVTENGLVEWVEATFMSVNVFLGPIIYFVFN